MKTKIPLELLLINTFNSLEKKGVKNIFFSEININSKEILYVNFIERKREKYFAIDISKDKDKIINIFLKTLNLYKFTK